jgi:N-acetylmuramoyl-L-alanine amidase
MITHVANGPGVSRGIANALAPKPRPGSALLQYTMIDNLDDDVRMVAHPARQGHLYVLAERDIPGVLVEMGFLSNRHDEALLKEAKYRLTIADAIRDAVDDYYAALKHPGALQT